MNYFKTIIFCWAVLFILFGLGLVFSEESFFQLSAIFSILFVVFYTYFSPSYFLNLEVSDSFAWFNFNKVPKIMAAVILGMPFWNSATFMALSALSFPGYVLFPFTIIFGVVSYFFAVKQHKTSFLSDQQFNFFLKNFKILVIILIVQALIILLSWDSYAEFNKIDWDAPYIQPGI